MAVLRKDGATRGDSAPMRLLEHDISASVKAQQGPRQAEQELLSALVSVAPLATTLSHQAQLVATSASGVRLFFRTTPTHGSDKGKLRRGGWKPRHRHCLRPRPVPLFHGSQWPKTHCSHAPQSAAWPARRLVVAS